jgi:hypothetical protein
MLNDSTIYNDFSNTTHRSFLKEESEREHEDDSRMPEFYSLPAKAAATDQGWTFSSN